MAFTNEWNEAVPTDQNYGYELDDFHRRVRTDVRERGGLQHKTYADESGETDVWEHKPGECNVVFIGAKANFPTPASSNAGCMGIATDENKQIYYWSGSAWVKVQEPMLITGDQTIAGTKTFSAAPVMTNGLTVGKDTDIGNYNLRAKTLQSDQPTGTAPLAVASTTKVANLNADMVDGKHSNEQFGAWAAKSVDVVYQADTDGFVCATIDATDKAYLQGYTDGSNPPTTLRMRGHNTYSYSSPNSLENGMMMPVRKGDYWKVTSTGSGGSPVVVVCWLPIGG
ncbi:MAG: hypothetical protein ACYSUP_11750 [Planctomycetota bacterium]|jgi:hypothetical protein